MSEQVLGKGDSLTDRIEENVNGRWLFFNTSHEASVLNAAEPTDEANRLLVDLGTRATLRSLRFTDYHLKGNEVGGYQVLMKARISHEVEGIPGEFDGWYVGEELHEATPAFLLLKPERVVNIPTSSP